MQNTERIVAWRASGGRSWHQAALLERMRTASPGTSTPRVLVVGTTGSRKMYASTSSKIEGALWRCLDGITHTVYCWDLNNYEQATYCGKTVRYRRGEWLYEMLGLAPTHSNCLMCATTRPWRMILAGTITGRMSSSQRNLVPRKQ